MISSYYKFFRKLFLFYLVSTLLVSTVSAQTPIRVMLSGKVIDSEYAYTSLQNVMIVNMTTQQGVFAFDGSTFEIPLLKEDTIVITALGYAIKKICYKDSAIRDAYQAIIKLNKLSVALKGTTIFEKRNLGLIEQDIKKLGYNPDDYKLHGVDAWQSPITALYQQFSRKEKSKRKVAELENDDRRKALLRELLYRYSLSELITLEPEEYDGFIEYMHLNDIMMQSMSQYDMALYIRERYFNYSEERK